MSAGFLLDTVVISELRKGKGAEPAVIGWQANIASQAAYLSVITLLEIRQGMYRISPVSA